MAKRGGWPVNTKIATFGDEEYSFYKDDKLISRKLPMKRHSPEWYLRKKAIWEEFIKQNPNLKGRKKTRAINLYNYYDRMSKIPAIKEIKHGIKPFGKNKNKMKRTRWDKN